MRRIVPLLFLMILSFSPMIFAQSPEFKPAWWCPGPHAQTICAALFRENPEIPYQRERVELPDGDFLDLDFYTTTPDKPFVIVFHGLASSAESASIKTLADEIHQRGWNAVVMNARGQSGSPNRLKVTNHAGKAEDVDAAVRYVIKMRMPEEVYLIGFSLGGNMLLKWLGDNPSFIPPQVKKAAAVSVAYDLEKVANFLDQDWFNREVYVRNMLKTLKVLALEKEKKFPGIVNPEEVKKIKTFKVYDREVTARLNGFKDEIDYWHQSSSKNALGDIEVPTLLIHADNDPFLPGSELPYQEMLKSSKIQLLVTRDGGHLGFVSGKWPWEKPKRWLEKTLLDYFQPL